MIERSAWRGSHADDTLALALLLQTSARWWQKREPRVAHVGSDVS
jgi:hypothetical protein